MSSRPFKVSEGGFSLIEMMVALAIISVVTFGILQMLVTNANATKSLELTNELDQTMTEIQMVLQSSAVCATNISGMAPNPFNPTTDVLTVAKVSSLTKDVITNNTALAGEPSSKLTINLENFQDVGSGNYVAHLAVTLDKGRSMPGAQVVKRKIPLTLDVAGVPPNLTIVGCYAGTYTAPPSQPLNIEKMCGALGGVFTQPLGPCSLTPSATPSTKPSGALVARCKQVSTGAFSCFGGASLPKECPAGSVLSAFIQESSGASSFDCVVP